MERTVSIGGAEVRLAAPKSLTIRVEIATLSAGADFSMPRAFGAALGACWQSGGNRPKAKHTGDMRDYGKRVIDELHDRGITWQALQVAGLVAWNLCTKDLITENEVTEAEGNSDEQTAPAEMDPSALIL